VTTTPRGGALPLLVLVLAGIAGNCTTVSTSPTKAVAIEFDSLPYPSVVTGDTLRDSLGRVAPLRAIAFNAAGARMVNPAITYIALDTGLTIDANGIVTAQIRNGRVRVVASVNGLQSVSDTIAVSRRPDGVVATGVTDTTLAYSIPDSASTNVTPILGVRVTTADTSGGITGTQGWLVSYQAFWHGQALSQSDTTVGSLWDEGTRISAVDTTAADGTAGRRLRVRSLLLLPTRPDTFVVKATVNYRGAAVAGSPVVFVIRAHPKQPVLNQSRP
jgi:hypothetical protein